MIPSLLMLISLMLSLSGFFLVGGFLELVGVESVVVISPNGITLYPVQADSAQLLSLWPIISAFFISIMSYTFASHSFIYLPLGLR